MMEEGRGSEYGCPGGMVQILSTKTWAWRLGENFRLFDIDFPNGWDMNPIIYSKASPNEQFFKQQSLTSKNAQMKFFETKQKCIFEVRLKKKHLNSRLAFGFFSGAGAGDDESNPPTIWVRRWNFQVKEVRVWWLWPSEGNTMEVKWCSGEVWGFWCGGLGRIFFPSPKITGGVCRGTKKGSLGGAWKNDESLRFYFVHICFFTICSFRCLFVVVFTIRGKNWYSKPWVVYSMYPGW